MNTHILSTAAYRRAVSIRDLTDPGQGPHALQLLVDAIRGALVDAWSCAALVRRSNPVVPIEDNYDRLHYPPDGAAREARYTRYVSDRLVLRTQTSAMIPPLLSSLDAATPRDLLLLCPGIVYRRDSIDRLHTGEPHQLDLWRLRRGPRLGLDALADMIAIVVGAALPGRAYRVTPARHPYTVDGVQLDVEHGGAWVEIGECGLALPELLRECGHDPARVSGLAMGLGLDRLLMLRKGVEDIRLLRALDPRVSMQMLDLAPYRAVSHQPPVRRDLSIVTGAELSEALLGDRVRSELGDDAACVESIELVAETAYAALPPAARARLGLTPSQKNVLLRLVLRHVDRALTSAEANALRNAVYSALHEGPRAEWAEDG
ncbi:MAG: hypothetical protein H6713_38800 [Myxococcales bacterium]|nr:hypothetical protein [Myxococcales bacterium]MCB9755910.1 hypothetical protein [Myxococcales bacterium]